MLYRKTTNRDSDDKSLKKQRKKKKIKILDLSTMARYKGKAKLIFSNYLKNIKKESLQYILG